MPSKKDAESKEKRRSQNFGLCLKRKAQKIKAPTPKKNPKSLSSILMTGQRKKSEYVLWKAGSDA